MAAEAAPMDAVERKRYRKLVKVIQPPRPETNASTGTVQARAGWDCELLVDIATAAEMTLVRMELEARRSTPTTMKTSVSRMLKTETGWERAFGDEEAIERVRSRSGQRRAAGQV